MTEDEVLTTLDVSRETSDRLKIYAALVRKWTPAINLVSKSSVSDLWGRHILDSAQILQYAPDNCGHWVDLGSGGGFPGLVVAILAAERSPAMRVTLVESDLRKATFLRQVAQDCALNTTICAERAEDINPMSADVLSARALAPLSQLLPLAKRHLAQGGTAIFPKGAHAANELAESLEHWRFSVQKHPSVTDPNAVILCIGDIERA